MVNITSNISPLGVFFYFRIHGMNALQRLNTSWLYRIFLFFMLVLSGSYYYLNYDQILDAITFFFQSKINQISLIFLLYQIGDMVMYLFGIKNSDANNSFRKRDLVLAMILNQGEFLSCVLGSFFYSFLISIIDHIEFIINGFMVKETLPSPWQHSKINIILFILLFSLFDFLLYLIATHQEYDTLFPYVHIFNTSCVIIDCISVLIYHFLFIFDRQNFGCSHETEKRKLQLTYGYDIVLNIVRLSLNFLRFENIMIGMILNAVFIINIVHSIINYFNTTKITSRMKQISNATVEDLARDDICIICREQMKIEQAKVLPCKHCFHSQCLEHWLGKSMQCPICSYNIDELFKTQEQNNQEQNNQEQNNQEQNNQEQNNQEQNNQEQNNQEQNNQEQNNQEQNDTTN
ncbi:hypothetical protein TRFO_01935 [Tritrichomonas foetus]|uniref:RING-type domain-containing protein n=1 Tax=Tritrichomonas foetus TaxID=1144522 RepID=A0A1J4JMU0_9EUKA|nr:hypothetical protein TRFO_01935 [Tritrichomonas foetus]|eukprot:OHS98851.1 hypothetical protein TRFO_01935 [Tritrichomonas foetus]